MIKYNLNTETAKHFAFSSGNINKYENVTGEKILLLKQNRIIEEA